MLLSKINNLKQKLEEQILNNCNYDDIYSTSIEIDRLLVDYYKNASLSKNVKIS